MGRRIVIHNHLPTRDSDLQKDIQDLLERGFDVASLKAKTSGLKEGPTTYIYSRSYKNPVGVEVLVFKPVSGRDANVAGELAEFFKEEAKEPEHQKDALTEEKVNQIRQRMRESGKSNAQIDAEIAKLRASKDAGNWMTSEFMKKSLEGHSNAAKTLGWSNEKIRRLYQDWTAGGQKRSEAIGELADNSGKTEQEIQRIISGR